VLLLPLKSKKHKKYQGEEIFNRAISCSGLKLIEVHARMHGTLQPGIDYSMKHT